MSTLTICVLALLICLYLAPAAFAQGGGPAKAAGAAFFISPEGNDGNDGSKAKPFATPAAARRAVRKLKDRGLPKGGATVYLRGGLYRLTETFKLTKGDSGTADAPIRYRAHGKEEVRIIGGPVIPASAFGPVEDKRTLERLDKKAAGRVLVADLKALGVKDFEPWPDRTRGGISMMELFFNRSPMQVARWPNDRWVTIPKILDRGSSPRWSKAAPRGGKFAYTGDRPKRWKVSKGVWLTGYWCHDWSDETIRVKSIDTDKRTITMAAPHTYGIAGKKRRHYAVNLLEELDAPGEWYIDAEKGLLYFLPPEKADFKTAEIILSVLDEPLIALKDVGHVIIESLTLESVRTNAVTITGGTANTVRNCLIRNTGRNAVVISGGAKNGAVGCEITQTGAGGVMIGGGNRRTLTPAGNFATDNHIHHFSRLQRTYAPAVRISGVGNRMAHNLIHDAPHMAVGFSGNENVMEYNEIHNVCRETGDVGVFYTGRDWTVRGNVLRYNFIHHVSGPGRFGAQGIYLDDAASGSIVRGNVLYKVQRAFLIGGGRDNIVENNMIIECPQPLMFDARGLGWMKDHVGPGGIMRKRLAAMPYRTPPWSERYPKLVNILDGEPGEPKGNVFRFNVIKSSGKMHVAKEAGELSTIADNLITAEPLGFADAKAMDFRLERGSPVFKKLPKFKAIPFDKIGPRKARAPRQH